MPPASTPSSSAIRSAWSCKGKPIRSRVTLDEMIYHTRMVMRGLRRSLVIADMPFMSYQVSPQQALENAGRLIKEGERPRVKLEGGPRSAAGDRGDRRRRHSRHGPRRPDAAVGARFGGFRVQRDTSTPGRRPGHRGSGGVRHRGRMRAERIWRRKSRRAVKIPTIGIGAGVGCDGQVLVTHDLLGLFTDFRPRFVKQFANVGAAIIGAAAGILPGSARGSLPGAGAFVSHLIAFRVSRGAGERQPKKNRTLDVGPRT